MNALQHRKYLWVFIFHLAVLVPLTACAKSPAPASNVRPPNYINQEFGFSLQRPESWTAGPSPAPNARVKLATPANTQRAECVVIVKRYPNAISAKQSDIDQVFLEAPSAAELKEILSQSAHEVEILAASSGNLDTRPAHLARVRYTVGAPPETTYVTGRVVMTATPGLTWTMSCGGQGNTAAEADKSFQYWQREINSIVSSFKFK
jgi:hypothetical protein